MQREYCRFRGARGKNLPFKASDNATWNFAMEREKYRRDSAGVATFLLAALTPLAIWGMVSAILMQLIEIRLRFVAGGESKLMQATLAFAAGVILCQRLIYYQGSFSATIYATGLGVAITWFSLYHAIVFRMPGIHPLFVFPINEALYALLWYGAHHLTKACAMDPDEQTIGEGVLIWHWKKALPQPVVYEQPEEEKQWTENMLTAASGKHPGRLILWIALGALPLFALTNYLTKPGDVPVQERLAFELTLYIVSTIGLLCLLALGQFRRYLEKRKASLPNTVGLAWMAMGGVTLSLIVFGSFLLPQPASTARFVIKDRINAIQVSIRRGLEDERDWNGRPGQAKETEIDNGNSSADPKGTVGSVMGTSKQSANPRGNSPEGEKRSSLKYSNATIFSLLLYAILTLLYTFFAISTVLIFIAAVLFLFGGIGERLTKAGRIFWQWTLQVVLRVRWESDNKERKPMKDFAAVVPFSDTFRDAGSVALVRYAWESLLQYCAQQGDPCDLSMTPREFLRTRPTALRGFEQQARGLADLYTFSEFSNRPLPESAEGELRLYWNAFLTFSQNMDKQAQS